MSTSHYSHTEIMAVLAAESRNTIPKYAMTVHCGFIDVESDKLTNAVLIPARKQEPIHA